MTSPDETLFKTGLAKMPVDNKNEASPTRAGLRKSKAFLSAWSSDFIDHIRQNAIINGYTVNIVEK